MTQTGTATTSVSAPNSATGWPGARHRSEMASAPNSSSSASNARSGKAGDAMIRSRLIDTASRMTPNSVAEASTTVEQNAAHSAGVVGLA